MVANTACSSVPCLHLIMTEASLATHMRSSPSHLSVLAEGEVWLSTCREKLGAQIKCISPVFRRMIQGSHGIHAESYRGGGLFI